MVLIGLGLIVPELKRDSGSSNSSVDLGAVVVRKIPGAWSSIMWQKRGIRFPTSSRQDILCGIYRKRYRDVKSFAAIVTGRSIPAMYGDYGVVALHG